jgi:hypothetical protein
VVIFSAPFLKNKTYFTAGCGKKKIPLGGNGLEKRIKILLELLAAIKKLPYLETLGPILDHFHWHRVVIDEGHEVLPDSLTSSKSYTFLIWKPLIYACVRNDFLSFTKLLLVRQCHSVPNIVSLFFEWPSWEHTN